MRLYKNLRAAMEGFSLVCKIYGLTPYNLLTEFEPAGRHNGQPQNRWRRIQISGESPEVGVLFDVAVKSHVDGTMYCTVADLEITYQDKKRRDSSSIHTVNFLEGIFLRKLSLREEYDAIVGMALETLVSKNIQLSGIKFDEITYLEWSDESKQIVVFVPRYNQYPLYVILEILPDGAIMPLDVRLI